MKVGIFLGTQHPASTDIAQAFRDHVEQVQTMESLGFDSLWVGQHYFSAPEQFLQATPMLARLAAESGNMQLGTNILLLPLHNPADRDHCLQFIVAAGLIHGTITADHYQDAAAADPRIDVLRARMEVVEEPRYSRDYLDPDKRSIANAVQVFFRDGSATERVEFEYPLGHRRRRKEAAPHLVEKFRANACTRLPAARVAELLRRLVALAGRRKRLNEYTCRRIGLRYIRRTNVIRDPSAVG